MKKNERRTVISDGNEIEYYLIRKNSRMSLRVLSDGSVDVIACQSEPYGSIDSFVREKVSYINEARSRLKDTRIKIARLDTEHKNGDIFFYLGKEYTLEIRKSEDDLVTTEGNKLIAATIDTENADYIIKLIRNWYYNRTAELFKRINGEVSAVFSEKYGTPKAEIVIKEFIGSWGRCYCGLGKIHMNRWLVHYPEETVRAVFVHEYAHFIVPNHSKSFYRTVYEVMPDYDRAAYLLN